MIVWSLILWICFAGVAYAYIAYPILIAAFSKIFGHPPTPIKNQKSKIKNPPTPPPPQRPS